MTNNTTFTCSLEFTTPVTVGSTSVDTFSFTSAASSGNSKGGFKWTRNINKNAIYVQLPVGHDATSSSYPVETEGGYGYDLGFVQDNFTLEVKTTDYSEYLLFTNLIKTNTGETPAKLTFGYPTGTKEYNVMPRYCSITGDAGTELMTISLTLTVVSKEYNTST